MSAFALQEVHIVCVQEAVRFYGMSSVVLRQKKKDSALGENTCHCFDYGRPFSADGGAYSTIAT